LLRQNPVEEVALINGKKFVYLSFKTSLKNKHEETVGILGISIDINKQKEAEEKLIQAKELSEAANTAKTEFLENMRHDIRTPLSAIVGLAELLNNENLDKSLIRKFTTNLDKASKELLRFLNEVLESINVASGEIPLLKKVFNFKKMLENVVTLHYPIALEKQLTLNYTSIKKFHKT
jgi:two-component system aerobic respiration control sensor histidine kinase ArcB